MIFVSVLDHCMVNFIKENLLGSIKEFRNRFINPIQNGQCADSTFQDVRIMKKRAHILYEMLAGCVQVKKKWPKLFSGSLWPPSRFLLKNVIYFCLPQRKDYTALTKFLPPKHEYVLSVRVTPIQCKLYRYYLEHFTGEIHVFRCSFVARQQRVFFGSNSSDLFGCWEQQRLLGLLTEFLTVSGLIALTGI